MDGEKDDDEKSVAVLELPPVVDANTAVQASIVAEAKRKRVMAG